MAKKAFWKFNHLSACVLPRKYLVLASIFIISPNLIAYIYKG